MPNGSTSPQAYMLRVAIEEIEYMEREFLLRNLPHVAGFMAHPAGKFLLRHLQNFCWTVERAWRNRGGLPPIAVASRDSAPAVDAAAAAATASEDSERPKVWIDVTNTCRSGFCGGIERAALALAKAATETGLALPVVIHEGRVHEYLGQGRRGAALAFAPGVTYVIADSFWQQIDEYRDVCATAKAGGAKVVICLHDVILLYYPSFNRQEFSEKFARCFAEMIEMADACIASSRYSREKVRAWIEKMRLRGGRPLPLTHFHLGADGHVCVDLRKVGPRIREIFEPGRPVFLSVGTLEPRKGYAVTLDGFDQLWRRGIECSLLIIGHPGWISKSLERRIIEHPRYGEHLHWLDSASDAELTFAYRNAHCVIQASITEGFGLPIVEANLEGTPVIATDNEIFRELAGDEITYFRMCDSGDLAEKVATAIEKRPLAGRLHPLKWDQSLAQMVSRVGDALAGRTLPG